MGEDASPEKGLLEKAATIKRFEYPPLGKELKKQTSIAEKQYRQLDEVRGLSKTELNKKSENSDLVYDKFDFNKFNNW